MQPVDKQTESLELVPLSTAPPRPEVEAQPVPLPAPPQPRPATTKPEETSGFAIFALVVGGLLIVALIIAGAISSFDWILGSNLKQTFIAAPLKVASYLFLTVISILAGIEISNLVAAEKNKQIRRSYVLSILVAGMLGYGLFYMHLQLQLRPPEFPMLITGTTIAGAVAGWALPSLLEEEPYGTLSYLMLLVLLIAFTWLARFEAVPTYGWAAFSAMVCYFFRSAMLGIRRAMAKRQTLVSLRPEDARKRSEGEPL